MEHQRVPRNTVTKRDEHWCTSGMQNKSVYPKSTRDEAQFPFIGSIAIRVPHHTEQVLWLPLENYRDCLRHPSQVYMNINFSRATRGKIHAHHIISRWELIPCLWLKRWANFPQALQEFFLSSRYVRGTLCFLSQVEWTPRGPDSKEGRISLQWLKFRLVFHFTRWRHVWIPCQDPRESRRSPPNLYREAHISLIPQEAQGIEYFKMWGCLTLLVNG